MKLCRFKNKKITITRSALAWSTTNSTVTDLTAAGIDKLTRLLEAEDPAALVRHLAKLNLPCLPLAEFNCSHRWDGRKSGRRA